MKVAQINPVIVGSTGKICTSISEYLNSKGIENYIFCVGNASRANVISYMSPKELKVQALKSRILGNYGFNSYSATKRLIKKLKEIIPDIVHLHILHSHNVHLELLFKYLRESGTSVVYTFHDCWGYTGYCTHYSIEHCMKWQTDCNDCCQLKRFSWFFDRGSELLLRKMELFKGVNISVTAPSQWMCDEIKKSKISCSNIVRIYNGIDLRIFYPRENVKDIQDKIGFPMGKKMILAVGANGVEKGLDTILELSQRISSDYQIVLVGKNDEELKQHNIIGIDYINDANSLAEIYSAADVFINPTKAETLGLVNIEALACGTPVVGYNNGGSPECWDETCGITVENGDIDAFVCGIEKLCTNTQQYRKSCVERAKLFDNTKMQEAFFELYSKQS